jgi:hypothetical protein
VLNIKNLTVNLCKNSVSECNKVVKNCSGILFWAGVVMTMEPALP